MSTNAAEEAWFADGEAYEGYIGRWSRPVSRLFIDWLSLGPDLRWVDVGCGTGALTGTLLDRAQPTDVLGIEPSEGFLRVARAGLVDDRARFEQGDAQLLPLADEEVDAAVSGLVLNFVPDQKRALSEMSRVVKAGGTVAAYVWDYGGEMQIIRHFWDAVGELFPESAGQDEALQFPICAPGPLTALFVAAGLNGVGTQALDTPTIFRNFEDYWSPFLRGQGPAGALCAGLADGDRERLRLHLKRRLSGAGGGSLTLTARAWAVKGTK